MVAPVELHTIVPKVNSRTQMETPSPEQILAIWQSLDSAERRRLVVQHLRETLSGNPLYAEMAAVTPDYWELLYSSCVRMIPYTWVARFGTSCTPAVLYAIRREQEAAKNG
jgi:hypothetical protein